MKKTIILLGVLFVSFSAVFVRFSDAPSVTLVFYRMGIACLCMVLPAILRCRQELCSMCARDVVLCAVSGIFLGFHFVAYFESLRYTGIGSAVVLANTEVFFVALAGMVLLKERVCPLGWLGIGLTFCGSVVVALGDAGGGSNVLRGDLLALLSAVLMSGYSLIGRVVRRTHTNTIYTLCVYGFAALTILLAGGAAGKNAAAIDGRNLLLCIGLAVVCTLGGHSVYSWGLRYETATFISTMKLLEPVVAALLGLAFFAEVPGITTMIGGVIIIAGIWWYSRCGELSERFESNCA